MHTSTIVIRIYLFTNRLTALPIQQYTHTLLHPYIDPLLHQYTCSPVHQYTRTYCIFYTSILVHQYNTFIHQSTRIHHYTHLPYMYTRTLVHSEAMFSKSVITISHIPRHWLRFSSAGVHFLYPNTTLTYTCFYFYWRLAPHFPLALFQVRLGSSWPRCKLMEHYLPRILCYRWMQFLLNRNKCPKMFAQFNQVRWARVSFFSLAGFLKQFIQVLCIKPVLWGLKNSYVKTCNVCVQIIFYVTYPYIMKKSILSVVNSYL